jgi:tetratricopeptide (TPR) repeat protein
MPTLRSTAAHLLIGSALALLIAVPATCDAGVIVPGPPPAPISLTASDGAGLELVSLTADAVVEDPLAFTELHLVFRNPEPRVREGRFQITLPAGATISRFAMRIDGRWQEGEVVEQQAARVAYEDFLHRRQDPALLETEAGNEFSARVFPIPAGGTKELVVSYAQELPRAAEPYRLPLRGLPRLGALTIRALVARTAVAPGAASSLGGSRAQHEVVEVSRRAWVPDRDFEVAHAGGRLGLRNDGLVVARVVPVAATDKRDPVASLAVLIDTSASRALGFGEQIAAVEHLLAELAKGDDPTVTVAAFDQDVAPVYTGKASGIGDTIRKRLTDRRALGASDLERALGWLAGAKDRRARVLLVTDGVATAGALGGDALRAKVKALAAAGVERLDVLAVGGIRDDEMMSRLVTAGLARDGVVLDGTQPAAAQARRLTRATRSGVKIEVPGAGWVWPSVVNGVQPGDELLIYADLPADKPFSVKAGGVALATSGVLAGVERPLLERAWVRARIARLLEQRDTTPDRDLADALKTQAIALSTKHRVLCPFTSLLVLETEQDYARFGIERRALADILTIGAGGIALIHRSDLALPLAAPAFPAEGEQALAATAKSRKQGEAADKAPRGAAPDILGGLTAPREAFAAAEASAASTPAAAPPPPAAAPPPPSPDLRAAARPRRAAAAAGKRDISDAPLAGIGGLGHLDGAPARDEARIANRVLARPEPIAEAKPSAPAVSGTLADVMALIRGGRAREALARALAWRGRDPGDVLALVALGESWEALADAGDAARAYGSIIDLFPGRADLRRFAGERLERVRGAAALALAIDTFRKAVEQRPDHPASHRLLGFALLKAGHPREAFEALAAGVAQHYPDGRFRGVDRILREDLGLAAAAWMRAQPAQADEIRSRLLRAGGTPETGPSIRFVLNWETDANDVDFHIHDGRGGHAFYSSPSLPSGGELYADVTTGYGPECFTIRAPAAARAFPYRLQAHYYSRGPMGYGMGKLEIIDHDGRGALRFEERPFVIMQDGAFVELGSVGAHAAGPISTSEPADGLRTSRDALGRAKLVLPRRESRVSN